MANTEYSNHINTCNQYYELNFFSVFIIWNNFGSLFFDKNRQFVNFVPFMALSYVGWDNNQFFNQNVQKMQKYLLFLSYILDIFVAHEKFE